jgi:hypothetical protein
MPLLSSLGIHHPQLLLPVPPGAGVDPFTCPFWWNHWKVALNLDWAVLEPALKTAISRLAEMRKAGGLPAAALQPGVAGKQEGAAAAGAHDRSLAESPAQQAQRQGGAAGLEPAAAELLAAQGNVAANGVPLSSLACLFDDGKAEHRLCVADNLLLHEGKMYYVAGARVGPQARRGKARPQRAAAAGTQTVLR